MDGLTSVYGAAGSWALPALYAALFTDGIHGWHIYSRNFSGLSTDCRYPMPVSAAEERHTGRPTVCGTTA